MNFIRHLLDKAYYKIFFVRIISQITPLQLAMSSNVQRMIYSYARRMLLLYIGRNTLAFDSIPGRPSCPINEMNNVFSHIKLNYAIHWQGKV